MVSVRITEHNSKRTLETKQILVTVLWFCDFKGCGCLCLWRWRCPGGGTGPRNLALTRVDKVHFNQCWLASECRLARTSRPALCLSVDLPMSDKLQYKRGENGLIMDLPLDSGINSSQIENNDKNLLPLVHVEKESYWFYKCENLDDSSHAVDAKCPSSANGRKHN
ncbi:hypothetical protein EVAR_87438_1 [Eumeta japonica]|uniref:Uncharacterized protein n=1 Tax=Eumeta variegata TaxID=151549 RepID=A0A4C1XGP9_EUMVA|nr:hypothetical protein EVAR_87438_1 [Eumeta japonica]